MAEFFRKIKEKLFPEPDFDLEDDEELSENVESNEGQEEEIETAEVDSSEPEIASGKKNKMIVIAASSLLITLVIYFLFFKEQKVAKPELEAVKPVIIPRQVAKSEDGKSPFEIEERQNFNGDELDVLEKPSVPEVPELPDELKDGDFGLVDDLFVKPEVKAKPIIDEVNTQEIAQKRALEENVALRQSVAVNTAKNPNQQATTDPRYAPIIVLKDQNGKVNAPSLSVGYEDNIKILNNDPILNLQKSAIGVQASFMEDRSTTVAQGKILTAVLETAISTEAPGSVRAVISRDVYGEAGSKVLIQRGSRLYGAYSTDTARGQARVQINWTRLIRPDGVDLNISSFASDQFGRAGIEGTVDSKYGQVVTNSLLTSILAVAGVAAAEALVGDPNQANTTTTVDPTNGTSTVTGRASTQAIYDVSQKITDATSQFASQYFDARPTITVPQGTRITVLVNADIKAPAVRR